MTKISRKPVSKEAIIISNFWRTATLLGNKNEVRDFLKALLTPTEMFMLAKRVEVARMLIHDCGYEKIKREVQVTNATITHIKNSLVNGSLRGYLVPLQRLEDLEAKIRKRQKQKLEKTKFTRETLSQATLKLAFEQGVKQYRKWQKFRSA